MRYDYESIRYAGKQHDYVVPNTGTPAQQQIVGEQLRQKSINQHARDGAHKLNGVSWTGVIIDDQYNTPVDMFSRMEQRALATILEHMPYKHEPKPAIVTKPPDEPVGEFRKMRIDE